MGSGEDHRGRPGAVARPRVPGLTGPVPAVVELGPDRDAAAAGVLLALRPRFGDAAALAAALPGLRAVGYRLLGSSEQDTGSGDGTLCAVAGFRLLETLAFGRVLYLDDLVTLPAARGRGHAGALLTTLDGIAADLGCAELHLDSGVGPDRRAAHRRYFGHGMRITAYHFGKAAGPG